MLPPPNSSTSKSHSAVVTTLAVTDDINGQPRTGSGDATTWNVGADEDNRPPAQSGTLQYPAIF